MVVIINLFTYSEMNYRSKYGTNDTMMNN